MLRRLFDPWIRRTSRRYVGQLVIATLALFVVLWAQALLTGSEVARAVLVAAIASSAFVLFIMPRSATAQPRNTIGGHILALGVGTAFAAGMTGAFGEWVDSRTLFFSLYAAICVGITIFLMAMTLTEHPPAAGTALGVVNAPVSYELWLFVGTATLMLVGIHLLLRSRLRNLI